MLGKKSHLLNHSLRLKEDYASYKCNAGRLEPWSRRRYFIEQTPAPVVFLTAADTDIQTLAAAVPNYPGFPGLRVASLLQLQQQLSIDTYAEGVLEQAQVIILRLLEFLLVLRFRSGAGNRAVY